MTNQPKWKLVGTFGDENPLDYGGGYVYIDETGVYDPEAELIEAQYSDNQPESEGPWKVYRFILDLCTFVNGVLSDNKYHPDYPAWFAQPESKRAERPQDTTYLKNVADYSGFPEEELVKMFCSDDPMKRVTAWEAVGSYHGFENLDDYPLTFTSREEIEQRYKNKNQNTEKEK